MYLTVYKLLYTTSYKQSLKASIQGVSFNFRRFSRGSIDVV